MSPLTHPPRLEDLPNIGQAIAADLRAIGIATPQQLAGRDPLATYRQLGGPMGRRFDPCVLYVLLAARHFLETGEAQRLWSFTTVGKRLLAAHSRTPKGVQP